MSGMARPATKVQFTIRVNAKLLEWLDAYAAAEGRARSEIVDWALLEFRDRHQSELPPGSPTPPPARPKRKG